MRPTILALLGLSDSYATDGRVITEPLAASALPSSLTANAAALTTLGATYKQLNAPFGAFAMNMLAASTRALASGSSTDDNAYIFIETQIERLTDERDFLAARIIEALNGAAFAGQPVSMGEATSLNARGQALLARAYWLGH